MEPVPPSISRLSSSLHWILSFLWRLDLQHFEPYSKAPSLHCTMFESMHPPVSTFEYEEKRSILIAVEMWHDVKNCTVQCAPWSKCKICDEHFVANWNYTRLEACWNCHTCWWGKNPFVCSFVYDQCGFWLLFYDCTCWCSMKDN